MSESNGSGGRADLDLAFLARSDLRPVRLLLEYLKPELSLREQGVTRTIVAFGSTRIAGPEEAQRRLAGAREARDAAPGNLDAERAVRVAERLAESSRYYDVARAFGAMAAERGDGVVMTGGGPGLMEAANRGSAEAGAATAGLNISLPREQEPNPWVTPALSFEFRYFALRKLHFVLRAVALVAFPGGYGTLDELFDVLTLLQTGKRAPLPVVLVGRAFWERAIDLDFLLDEGLITPADRALVAYAESAPEIFERIDGFTPPPGEHGDGGA